MSNMVIEAQQEKDNLIKLGEVWEINQDWVVEKVLEEEEVVKGKTVLGTVTGQFFVPDGYSRNKRYYSKELWEKTINSPRVQELLKNKLMFGMIGHEPKDITEDDLAAGKVSHLITNLWIDEQNRGMGEAKILNTVAGKNLFTYLNAGSQLKTSSRALGKIKQVSKPNEGNENVVDKDSYVLRTFDFVIHPGFVQTSTNLTEEIIDGNFKKKTKEDLNMASNDTKLVNDSITKNIDESFVERYEDRGRTIAQLRTDNESLNKEINELRKQYTGDINELVDKIQESGLSVKELSSILEGVSADSLRNLNKFETLTGYGEHLNELPEKPIIDVLNTLKAYEDLGDVDNLRVKLYQLEDYESLGSIHDIENVLEESLASLQEYRAIGPVNEIRQTLKKAQLLADKIEEMGGSLPFIENLAIKVSDELESYKELGSIEDFVEIRESLEEERNEKEIDRLSQEFGCSREHVSGLMRKYTASDVEELLQDASELVKNAPLKTNNKVLHEQSYGAPVKLQTNSLAESLFKEMTGGIKNV